MANLASPAIVWGTPGLQPRGVGVPVPNADIAPNDVVVYTSGVASVPAFNQLANEKAHGTPF